MNSEVDKYLGKATKWQKEMKELRKIILGCGLDEEFKWRAPCYTFQGSNLVIFQGFKDYCAIMFFKGALLKDPKRILKAPGKNTQATRQLRFTSYQEIVKMTPVLKAYIQEAIQVERAGLKVEYKKTSDFTMPEELRKKLNQNPKLKTAFNALTPGRQRAYILYFSEAKQTKTRELRIEKWTNHILAGKGLNDV